MKNKILLSLILTPLFLGGTGSIYGQNNATPPPPTDTGGKYSKIGNNPFYLDPSAALEVASTSRGFLPPRMDKAHRDAVKTPAPGLIVWCTDCDDSTIPKKGQFSVYTDDGWVTYLFSQASVTSNLTTGRKNETNAPVRISDTSVQISGFLGNTFGTDPTETGVVYREIIDNDFATLPVLDDTGLAVAPAYKKLTDPAVTTANSPITVTISDLTSENPYYFRTYAKSPAGIRYGNTVIFNTAPPGFSNSTRNDLAGVYYTNGNPLLPVIKAKLIVNAGTPQNTITEYGYCISLYRKNDPTIADNRVVLSETAAGVATLDLLNDKLNSETFTANPTVSLFVNDLNTMSESTIFRFYAIANGKVIYSNSVNLPSSDINKPVVTGGSAEATFIGYEIQGSYVETGIVLKIGENLRVGTGFYPLSFSARFKVTKAGTYSFTVENTKGATTGLSITSLVTGSYAADDVGHTKTSKFVLSGTPETSLEGNTFKISGMPTPFTTGTIRPFQAICDGSAPTEVVEVSDVAGRIWMDRNLGASRAAISVDDYKAFGCLFQWGRGNDGAASVDWVSARLGMFTNGITAVNARSGGDTPGNQYIPVRYDWRSTPNDALWQGVDGKNNPCPAGFRIPTKTEFQTALTGVTNMATAYATPLKLVKSLSIVSDDYYRNRGVLSSDGNGYWTNTIDEDSVRKSANINEVHVIFFDYVYYRGDYIRYRGSAFSVRCIKN